VALEYVYLFQLLGLTSGIGLYGGLRFLKNALSNSDFRKLVLRVSLKKRRRSEIIKYHYGALWSGNLIELEQVIFVRQVAIVQRRGEAHHCGKMIIGECHFKAMVCG